MAGSEQLVACSVGSGEYAFHISGVREIIRDEGAVGIGTGAGAMLGVVDLRGVAMPVYDLRVVLGVEPEVGDRESRRVVVTTRAGDEDVVGWLVDGVEEVLTVSSQDVESLDRAASELVRSVARAPEGRLLPVLDVERLLEAAGITHARVA